MDHCKELYTWPNRERTCAKALAEQLRIAGLIVNSDNLIIGNPGSGEELLYLELTDEIFLGLAEPALGSIADGAGRVKSKPAVAIAHGFVGFSGIQGAVFNAVQRQSPMLVIVRIADSNAHTGETHMYADVEGAAKATRCKYVKNATDPETLLRDLRDTIVEAMTPPFGPVVFIVPSNIAIAPNNELIFAPRIPNSELAPPYPEIELLAEELLSCQNPGILIGDGIARSKAYGEIIKVAELLCAEVWASMESEVNFPRNHPLFKGNLGHMWDDVGRELLKNLDYALAVGTPIYQTVFNSKKPLFNPEVRIAAINQDTETTLRGHNDVTLPIRGDPKRVLELLVLAIEKRQSSEMVASMKRRIENLSKEKQLKIKYHQEQLLAQPGVTMAKFAHLLEEHLKGLKSRPVIFNEALIGAIGLSDFIGNVDLPGKYYDTSGGTLGEWAGAIGASIIYGPTIVFIGDGGFNYTPQALWNAAKNNLPIGFIVANNANYGLLYANMNTALNKMKIDPKSIPKPHYYNLPGIDYVKIGEGYGVPGIRIEKESQIEQAVNKILEFKGPHLIDLVLSSTSQ